MPVRAVAGIRIRLGIGVALLAAPACLRVPEAEPVTVPPASAPAPARVSGLVAPARGPGELYPLGHVRAFRIEQGGALIGRSWGRYAGRDPEGHHVFETRIELLPPGMTPVRSAGELRLDDTGALVAGFERSSIAALTFQREGEVLTITDGRRSDSLAFDETTGFIAHGAILHTEMMLAMRRLAADEMSWRVVSLSGGPPFSWSAEIVDAPSQPGGRATIETNLGERITIQDGRIVELTTKSAAQRVVEASDTTWPTWSVQPPRQLAYQKPAGARFAIEPVSVEGREGEPTLAGELLVPPSAHQQPAPAVLFLSRMAGEDRYGLSGPPAADLGSHEIHDALAEAGFVVLRFDERGIGASEAGKSSYLGQLQDARRAYATLLVQPTVDPARVIVVGHGEGALRALTLGALEGKHLAGVVALAMPGRRYADVLRAQAEARLGGAPPEVRRRALIEQDEMVAAVQAGHPPPELAPHADWLAEIFAVDPVKLVAQQRAPLLLVQGGKDFEADPQRDLDLLVRAAQKHRRTHTVLRYPDLDHLFKRELGLSRPERYREDRPVDAEFLTDLVAWARRTAAKR